MLSREELNSYIEQVPALPNTLKECSKILENGDLVKAAHIASCDKALMMHFQNIVNKPIFGFRDELKDANQIFGALGIRRVKQILKSYYTLLLMPKSWDIFKLNTRIFQELQADLMVKWETILESKNINDEEISAIITLIPAAIAVCENIFKEHNETIDLIKAQKAISYEEILYKMSGYNFFNIVTAIAKKWEFSEKNIQLLQLLSNKKSLDASPNKQIAQYLSLLINYELSRPVFIESGINDLFEIDTNFPEQMVADFYSLMEKIAP